MDYLQYFRTTAKHTSLELFWQKPLHNLPLPPQLTGPPLTQVHSTIFDTQTPPFSKQVPGCVNHAPQVNALVMSQWLKTIAIGSGEGSGIGDGLTIGEGVGAG